VSRSRREKGSPDHVFGRLQGGRVGIRSQRGRPLGQAAQQCMNHVDRSARIGVRGRRRLCPRVGDNLSDGVSHGFQPHCFIESIAQAGLTVNFPYLLDVQASHVAWIIAWGLARGVTEIEASPDAEAALGRYRGGAVGSERRACQDLHAGLLQPRRQGGRQDSARQFLLRRAHGICRNFASVANQRDHGGVLDLRRRGWSVTSRRARWYYGFGRVRAAGRRTRPPKVAIIGAGFGGLGAAVALRRASIDDIVIIEGGDGVGGTWPRNTYPGAACDIQGHLY